MRRRYVLLPVSIVIAQIVYYIVVYSDFRQRFLPILGSSEVGHSTAETSSQSALVENPLYSSVDGRIAFVVPVLDDITDLIGLALREYPEVGVACSPILKSRIDLIFFGQTGQNQSSYLLQEASRFIAEISPPSRPCFEGPVMWPANVTNSSDPQGFLLLLLLFLLSFFYSCSLNLSFVVLIHTTSDEHSILWPIRAA
jgi:hypothetical protein